MLIFCLFILTNIANITSMPRPNKPFLAAVPDHLSLSLTIPAALVCPVARCL
jgi:hypothetical protein